MNIDKDYEILLRDIEIVNRCANSIKDECYIKCTCMLTTACNKVYNDKDWPTSKKKKNFKNIVECLDAIRLEVHKEIIIQRRV